NDRSVQLVSARLQAIGDVEKAPQAEVAGGGSFEDAKVGSRPGYFDAQHGRMETPAYHPGALPADQDLGRPALINEMSATSVILPGQIVRADRWGNLVVRTNA